MIIQSIFIGKYICTISLLKLIGYSDDVVNEARNRADNFIRYGSWYVK